MRISGLWITKNVQVKIVEFDGDLLAFRVRSLEGDYLGDITPDSAEEMNAIIADLQSGGCPIADHWEDGNGNVCTMYGWGE